jgi:Asp/Glu/hydantoin racemase
MEYHARPQRVQRCERRQAQRRADHALARALAVILGCCGVMALCVAGLSVLLDLPLIVAWLAVAFALINLLAAAGVGCWDMSREVQYIHWLKRQG